MAVWQPTLMATLLLAVGKPRGREQEGGDRVAKANFWSMGHMSVVSSSSVSAPRCVAKVVVMSIRCAFRCGKRHIHLQNSAVRA